MEQNHVIYFWDQKYVVMTKVDYYSLKDSSQNIIVWYGPLSTVRMVLLLASVSKQQ